MTYYEETRGVVSDAASLEILETSLPVVHDQLDAVPECQGVAGVDDEPHQAAADAGQKSAHDSGSASVDQLVLVAGNMSRKKLINKRPLGGG